jgi:hypothetical protein
MKTLSVILSMSILIVCSSFKNVNPAPGKDLYPELEQSFKQLRKDFSAISYDRKDDLTGIQQIAGVAKQHNKPVIIEMISNDGFTAPFAKAVLKAALADLGINEIKILTIGSAPSEKVAPALSKLGFKVSNEGGLTAKFNDQGEPLTFTATGSGPEAVHVFLNDGSAAALSAPDKFAIKLNYPNLTGVGEEKYQQQAKLIATEMLFVAMKIKDNHSY